MLSLKTYDIPTLEVEAPDGEILHVLPASKRMIEKIAAMESGNPEALAQLYKTLAECLSENREGKAITEDMLADIPVLVVKQIMIEYATFIHGRIDGAKN